MNEALGEPKHILLTKQYAPKFVLGWCGACLLIGMAFVGIELGTLFPVIALLMTFLGSQMLKFLISFHKNNRFMTRKIFDFFILFFWVSGVSMFLWQVFNAGTVFMSGQPIDSFASFASAIFPIGFSFGAAQKWEQRFEYD